MFARVTTFQGSPDREATVFSAPAPAEVQAMRGYKGSYTLENRKTGKAMIITFWETEDDLNASAGAVKPIRVEKEREAGATSEYVESFEVLSHP